VEGKIRELRPNGVLRSSGVRGCGIFARIS
jgi:hypothetical protein